MAKIGRYRENQLTNLEIIYADCKPAKPAKPAKHWSA